MSAPAMEESSLANTTVQVTHEDGHLALRRRTGSTWVGVVFTLIWFAWSVACVYALYDFIVAPSWLKALLPIPFWAAWIFQAYLVNDQLTGVEELTVTDEVLTYGTGRPPVKPEATIPREEIRRVEVYDDRDFEYPSRVRHGVMIETTGDPVRFGVGLTEQECDWVARILHKTLDLDAEVDETVRSDSPMRRLTKDIEILSLDDQPDPPPAEGRIRLLQREGATQFTSVPLAWREVFPALLGVTLLAVIWNGFLAVFVVKLIDNFNWGDFYFLVPFGVISLVIIIFLVRVLMRPFQRVSYIFNADHIDRRFHSGRRVRHHRYSTEYLDHLELRWTVNSTPSAPRRGMPFQDGRSELEFALAFVNRHHADTLVIPDLTQAEARWIADVLLREYHEDWFEN